MAIFKPPLKASSVLDENHDFIAVLIKFTASIPWGIEDNIVINVKNISSLVLKLDPGCFFLFCLSSFIKLKIIVAIKNIGRTIARGIKVRLEIEPLEDISKRTLFAKIRINIINTI